MLSLGVADTVLKNSPESRMTTGKNCFEVPLTLKMTNSLIKVAARRCSSLLSCLYSRDFYEPLDVFGRSSISKRVQHRQAFFLLTDTFHNALDC